MSYFSNYSDVTLFTNPSYLSGGTFSAVVAFGTDIYVASDNPIDPVAIYKIDFAGNVTTVITRVNLTFSPLALGIDSLGTTLIAVSGFSEIATINTTTLQRDIFTKLGGVDVSGNGNIYVDSPTSFYIVNQIGSENITYVTLTPGPDTFTAIDYTAINSTPFPVAVALDPLTNTLYTGAYLSGFVYSYPAGVATPASVTTVTTLGFNISDLTIIVEGGQSYLYIVSRSNNTLSKYLINGGALNLVDVWNSGTNPKYISYSQIGGTGTLRYYLVERNTTSNQSADLSKLYLTVGGSAIGGDPHIKPLFGKKYDLPNIEACFKLFDNKEREEDKIIINTKCWFLPQNIIDEYDEKFKKPSKCMQTYTYIKYVSFITNDSFMIIDIDTLEPVKFTNCEDLDTFQLKEIDVSKHKNIELGQITENTKGLWSVSKNDYCADGKVYERAVNIKTKNYYVELILSYIIDCTKRNNIDRNNMRIKIKGKKEISVENYIGALICEGNNLIQNILSE